MHQAEIDTALAEIALLHKSTVVPAQKALDEAKAAVQAKRDEVKAAVDAYEGEPE